ncbi:MAG: hypothetical protein ACE5OZ_11885 [Candidatus Heimdallarchaeota archaeon]
MRAWNHSKKAGSWDPLLCRGRGKGGHWWGSEIIRNGISERPLRDVDLSRRGFPERMIVNTAVRSLSEGELLI